MKSLFSGFLAFLVAPTLVAAEPLAICGEERGTAYFPMGGPDGGWQADGITGGSVTLELSGDFNLDILFYDARKIVQSARGMGAEIRPLALGPRNISVLVTYKGSTSEIYDFYDREATGAEFSHLVLKPANSSIPKAAVYVGKCQSVDLASLQSALDKKQ